MVVFETFFRKSKGKPIVYKGRRLCLGDLIEFDNAAHMFRLTFEQSNSEWRQGVVLTTTRKGVFEIEGEKLGRQIVLWQDTAPKIVTITLLPKSKELEVHNVWHNGRWMQSGHAGAAMYIEKIPGGKRYHCNDGHMNDDLNDLIFTLEEIHEEPRADED